VQAMRQAGFPERTPLSPRVVATEDRDGYRAEKVICRVAAINGAVFGRDIAAIRGGRPPSQTGFAWV